LELLMKAGALMDRYAQISRLNTKTYLTGIIATIPPQEGTDRFNKFLGGVLASGLSNKCNIPANWRWAVAFIEVANCAYAYGFKRLYPQIQLKIAVLRKTVKDNPRHNPDRVMMDRLAVIAGGKLDYQWNMDEAPWWNY